MSWKEIIECLQQGENESIEFLVSVSSTEHLLRYVTAFLNASGGKLIIGVDDKNDHLVGSNVSKTFIDTAIQKIDPSVYISCEEIVRLGKTVLFLRIPEGTSKPYSYRGKYYYRKALEIVKHSKDEIIPVVGQEKSSKLNTRQEKALEFIKKNEVISNKLYRNEYSVSHKTAHIELTDLLNRGLIDKFGLGRNTAYRFKAVK